MNTLNCQKGAVVFREGEAANCMYEVLRGRVGIYAFYDEAYPEKLDELGAHGVFGEMGFMDAQSRSATAVAMEESELREIGIGELRSYFREKPEKLLDIMRYLGNRTRDLTQDYSKLREALRESAKSMGLLKEKREGVWQMLVKFAERYHGAHKPWPVQQGENAPEDDDHSKGFAKQVRSYQKGEVIFREGDESGCMYDIHWGSVGIYLNYGAENEKLLITLTVNRFFGEIGMLHSLPRSATAVAMEDDTQLELIAPEDLEELMEKNPNKVEMIMKHLSSRLRSLTRDYMDACRLASELVRAEQSGDALSEETKARILIHTGE